LEFFDCYVSFGPSFVPPLAPCRTAEELLAEMRFCGVQRALVHFTAQVEDSPVLGNRLLSEAVTGHPELVPSWALLPPSTGEQGSVDEFLAAMRDHGVRALWAFPSQHLYLLNATGCGPLLEELVARRIPLFLRRSESSGSLAGWDLPYALLQEFPLLNLVVVGHGPWGEDRFFRPLLERYPSFRVDTARYELDGGIPGLVGRYGPHRLLFSTAFPATCMGGALLTLLHADIPDEAKAAIAAGNLERLLGEVQL